ncbi:hypothetical protein R3P38DRAFT_3199331 [Favolaschia claudopus]|uniref:Secreted protein n=1 Tax=Favolaschia claudopus TaxID=2862362 RepID=A0AAW0B111_9AGAR
MSGRLHRMKGTLIFIIVSFAHSRSSSAPPISLAALVSTSNTHGSGIASRSGTRGYHRLTLVPCCVRIAPQRRCPVDLSPASQSDRRPSPPPPSTAPPASPPPHAPPLVRTRQLHRTQAIAFSSLCTQCHVIERTLYTRANSQNTRRPVRRNCTVAIRRKLVGNEEMMRGVDENEYCPRERRG